MDLYDCYPTASYAPYWFICIAFITSVLIQIATFTTGNGIISYIKACLTCQGCRGIKYNMAATNGWNVDKPPKRINIAPDSMVAALRQKDSKKAAIYYGNYLLQLDDNNNIYYQSDFQSTHNKKRYILKHINQRQYEGWILIEEGAQSFKFEMIQIREPEVEQKDDLKQDETVKDSKEKPNTLYAINFTSVDDLKPLSLLDFQNQKFKAYPPQKIQITSHNIVMSQFLNRITNFHQHQLHVMGTVPCYNAISQNIFNFNIGAHWIQLSGLRPYKHNTFITQKVLDLNGRYKLNNVIDNSGNSQFGQSTIQYEFQLMYYGSRLRAVYTIFLFAMRNNLFVNKIWIDIKHEAIGKLAEFEYSILENHDIEYMPYHPNNFECAHSGHCTDPAWPWETTKRIECQQYVFEKGIEIILRVKDNNGCKYYAGKTVILILILMIFYQFIADVIMLAAIDDNLWDFYECYAFIVTNSANMKQFCIFVLCSMLLGDAFADRKIMGFTGEWFKYMGKIYAIFFVPVLLTHVLPFAFLYFWWMICCYYYYLKKRDIDVQDRQDDNTDIDKHIKMMKSQMKYIFIGLLCYFLFILLPVSTMSSLYRSNWQLNEYFYSFVDVFSDRKTSNFFRHYEDLWKSVEQFCMWLF